MRTAHPLKTVLGLALAAAMSGCLVVHDQEPPPPPPPPAPFGTLTAAWTLNGSPSASACAFYAIDRVDIIVYDDTGFVAAAAQPFCEAFEVSFDLPAGFYTTRMTLLALGGGVASDAVIVDLRVAGYDEVFVDADFPDASIF